MINAGIAPDTIVDPINDGIRKIPASNVESTPGESAPDVLVTIANANLPLGTEYPEDKSMVFPDDRFA